jgi:hypothetical protein
LPIDKFAFFPKKHKLASVYLGGNERSRLPLVVVRITELNLGEGGHHGIVDDLDDTTD